MNLPIHSACRAVGIPIFTNEPENIPVGAMALKLGGIDTVITESRTVAAFADHLIEHALPYPKLSVLLHRVEEVPDVPSAVRETWGVVSQEILAFPGVPVLEQCALLAEKKVPLFHLSDAYFWEISDTSSLITSIGEDPFPLFRYALACTLRRTGECGCGRAVFEHNV
jgi:hypothetical protein